MNECHSMRHFRIDDVEVPVYRAKTLVRDLGIFAIPEMAGLF